MHMQQTKLEFASGINSMKIEVNWILKGMSQTKWMIWHVFLLDMQLCPIENETRSVICSNGVVVFVPSPCAQPSGSHDSFLAHHLPGFRGRTRRLGFVIVTGILIILTNKLRKIFRWWVHQYSWLFTNQRFMIINKLRVDEDCVSTSCRTPPWPWAFVQHHLRKGRNEAFV